MKIEVYEAAVNAQRELCQKYGAEYVCSSLSSKLGISEKALESVFPIHGLRHSPGSEISGWYIWSEDYSEDPNFFEPMHVEHAISESAIYARYLGLAPGWRFLIAEDGYEDVWFDPGLLEAGK